MTVSADDRRALPVRDGAEANVLLQISRRPRDGAGKVGVPAGIWMGASTLGERPMRLRLLHSAEGLPGSVLQSQLLQLLLNLNDDVATITCQMLEN